MKRAISVFGLLFSIFGVFVSLCVLIMLYLNIKPPLFIAFDFQYLTTIGYVICFGLLLCFEKNRISYLVFLSLVFFLIVYLLSIALRVEGGLSSSGAKNALALMNVFLKVGTVITIIIHLLVALFNRSFYLIFIFDIFTRLFEIYFPEYYSDHSISVIIFDFTFYVGVFLYVVIKDELCDTQKNDSRLNAQKGTVFSKIRFFLDRRGDSSHHTASLRR